MLSRKFLASCAISKAPDGHYWADAEVNGSQVRFVVRVEIKIPLLGGKLEKSMGAGLAENIPALQRFTSTWIAEHHDIG